MTISDEIICKINASAAQYATINANLQFNKPSNPIIIRIKATVGYECIEEDFNSLKRLNAILALIVSAIKSEKRKAQKRSLFYNRFRHIELHHIFADLIKKRSNL